MNPFLLKLSAAIALLFCCTMVSAHDFEVGGIYYNIKEDGTCEVTFKGDYPYADEEYSGSVTIPSEVKFNGNVYSVTGIGEEAFRSCSGLKSVNISSSVKSIGSRAFSACTDLTDVRLEDGDLPLSIGDMNDDYDENYAHLLAAFYGCKVQNLYIGRNIKGYYIGFDSSLKNVTISNSVTSIGKYVFKYCTSLTSVRLEDGDKLLEFENKPFEGCNVQELYLGRNITDVPGFGSSLIKVTISNSVDSLSGSIFEGCHNLTSVTIPNSVISIGNFAFSDCTGLTSITIPNSVTNIGGYAFDGCTGLTNITIPNSVTKIGYEAFAYCCNIKSLTIGNSIKSIGTGDFSGCSALKELSLGTGLKNIEYGAFADSEELSKIPCNSTIPPTASLTTFYEYTYANADVYVPQGSLYDYGSDNIWKLFLNLHGADLTGINGITADGTTNGGQRIYDLQGRKLKKPIRGLNIINGKKVVVK